MSASNKPIIEIWLYGGEGSIIDVTNIGQKPATNLTLTVKTDENISVPVNYSIFNTQDNISSLELDSKSIQINIPRLVQERINY